jgi:hypothetical protein
MTLLEYCLVGLCAGAGIPLFGALAVTLYRLVTLFRLPDTMNTHQVTRLSLPTAFLCLSCPCLIFVYLSYYTTMPRALFVGCVAGGVAIGILALLWLRWKHVMAHVVDKFGQTPSPGQQYDGHNTRVLRDKEYRDKEFRDLMRRRSRR